MAKIKTQCHICGARSKSVEPLSICPNCGADLTSSEEIVQKQIHCQFRTTTFNGAPGWLYLTNLRLLWVKDKNTAAAGAAFGLVGALAAAAASGNNGKVGFSIPLEDIDSIEDDKIGLTKALRITTKSNGELGKLGISKRDEWRDAIQHAALAKA